jgi:hypothetical protein
MLIEYLLAVAVGGSLLSIAGLEWGSWQERQRTRERLHRLEYPPPTKREAAGARPRITTHPLQEGRWDAAPAPTGPGSLASTLPPGILDSLQALGVLASRALFHAAHYSESVGPPEALLSRYKTLAQAVVDLASTSAKQATRASVAPEPGAATSGSRSSSDRAMNEY